MLEDLTLFTVVGDALRPVQIELKGDIVCANAVRIAVTKRLETRMGRNRRLEVRTYGYRYHAYVGARELLRYDNSYDWRNIHRHEFDASTGEQSRVVPVTREQMPTLFEFVSSVGIYLRRDRLRLVRESSTSHLRDALR